MKIEILVLRVRIHMMFVVVQERFETAVDMFVCCPECQKKYRQLFPKELSHLSLPRNIMYIQIFWAQRECWNLRRTFSPHHSFSSIQFLSLLILTNAPSLTQCSVIFGMLIALPITLVYYILMGLWMQEMMDDTEDSRVPSSSSMQCKIGFFRPILHQKTKGSSQKALLEEKHNENWIGRTPGSVFLSFFLHFVFVFFFNEFSFLSQS